MTAAYVAIDSGGTRTNAVLVVESEGQPPLVRSREIYESLSGYLSPHEYMNVLRHILAPLEAIWHEQALTDVPIHLFISAAGYSPSTREPFLAMFKEVLPESFGGNLKYAGIANDAVSLLLGLETDGVVIAGTGSNVLVRSHSGSIFQAGGQEWVANDYGAGFWIGLGAIRAVARAFEAGEETTLLHRFCNEYHVQLEDEAGIIACFRRLGVSDGNMKAEIAKFAASVCAAAQKGDEEAQRIVKTEAEDLATSLVVAIRRRLAADDIDDGLSILQCGSVFSSTFYRSSFESMVSISLYGTTDTSEIIRWESVEDGRDAALTLARRLESAPESLQDIDDRYLPLILAF